MSDKGRMRIKISNRAFTLVELMVAAFILLFAISGMLVAFVSSTLLNESNNNLVIAVNDAQFVLEQIKGVAYTSISSYSAPTFTSLSSETITLSRNVGTRIAEVTVNVSWSERGSTRNFSLSTRISS